MALLILTGDAAVAICEGVDGDEAEMRERDLEDEVDFGRGLEVFQEVAHFGVDARGWGGLQNALFLFALVP